MTSVIIPVQQEEAVPEATSAGVPVDVFSALYRTEMPRLVRFLIRCGADLDNAKDAAQHAFLVLFEKWENVIYPEAYLRTVAFRRFHQQRTIYEQPLDSHDNHGGAAARDPVELEEETRAVLAVLRQLPLTQRQVMALYYDQFTIGEISEILGMTQMAVRQNLKRAREKLKTALGLDQPRLRRAA